MMKTPPLISVVVPAYNAGKFLGQCLENLRNQSYKQLEIIVVDDGSTDNTSLIAKQFPEINYIFQKNSGVSVARNTGIDAAAGEYIHFMDADDLINAEFYERMLQSALEENADLACCGFDFERFPDQSQYIEKKITAENNKEKLLLTDVWNYGACWKYLCKLSFLRENNLRFEKGISAGEDRMFSMQAVYFAKKIVSVPTAVYFYKHHNESVTVNKNLKVVKRRHADRKTADQFLYYFAKKHQIPIITNRSLTIKQVDFLGIPMVVKKRHRSGKMIWYLFGIPIFQKKDSEK